MSADSNMGTVSRSARPTLRWMAGLLLAIGLLGHLLSARAIGGSRLAYSHHIVGFFLILVVTGGLVAGLGWIFWRRRWDATLLTIGVVQAVLGFVIYVLTLKNYVR